MKIAIPEHQGRVAPVFDACRRILVFSLGADTEEMVAQEDWSGLSAQRRAARLKEMNVDVLLCGGISCWIEDQIHLRGIRLIAWLAGDVPKILEAFKEQTITDPEYAMPGTLMCRRRRRMRREGGGAHRPGAFASKESKPCQG